MQIIDLDITKIGEASWNPNEMDEPMLARLRGSIIRYGLVENLVVRPVGNELHEVLSGNHRLRVLKELGFNSAPCIVVNIDDGHARLLSQALNRIHGEDDLGLRAELVRKVLETVPEAEITAVLPETTATLDAIASLGQADLKRYLENWGKARAMRLRHLGFRFTEEQLNIVEKALNTAMPEASRMIGDNPNLKGNALYIVCKAYLKGGVTDE